MRIIICDDHPIVVLSLTQLFRGSGHEVVATGDRPDGLRALVAVHRPDVCVLDLVYGDVGDTTAAIDAVAAIAPLTDVIVLAGSGDERALDAARAAGASAVISKCSAPEVVLALVEGRRSGAPVSSRRPANPFLLTRRELEVLQSLVEGDSTERMAARLQVRHATARSHVQSLMLKLGVHTRSAAVTLGVRAGLSTPADPVPPHHEHPTRPTAHGEANPWTLAPDQTT